MPIVVGWTKRDVITITRPAATTVTADSRIANTLHKKKQGDHAGPFPISSAGLVRFA